MDNVALKQHIIEELEFDPQVDASRIGVIVDNGIVTLTGRVLSYAEAAHAEEVTRSVAGVRAIAQEIKVVRHDPEQPSDEELASSILKMLHMNSVIPEEQVHIMVRDGCVTATGQVDRIFQKNAVTDAIREVRGVIDYVNQMTIAKTPSDSDMESDIAAILARRSTIDPDGIEVSYHAGKVTLTGHIDEESERTAIRRAILSVPGVNEIADLLTHRSTESLN